MIAIVGGGLAAAKLVEGYRGAGGEEEIVIWSQDPHGPYHRPPLSKRLLRGEAEPADALITLEGVDLRLSETVASLDDVEADTVVLAMGARPKELPGMLHLRTLDDSLELRRRAREAKTATVVGGGFIGCEVTASLTALGLAVTQIVREPMVFPSVECPPLSEALADLYREHGVDLRLGETEVPEADLAVAGIGVEPNVELAREAGLEVRSGIVVDEYFRTAARGSTRSGTSPSSTTRSTGATGGSSIGRTPPTTARRSARSSPERTRTSTTCRRSSRRSSAGPSALR